MKKSISLILTLILLCGCTAPSTISEENSNSSKLPSETAPTAVIPTDEPTQSPTIEPSENVTVPSVPSEPATEVISPEPDEPEIVYAENGYTPKALMYHLVLEKPYNYSTGLFVRPVDLEAQIQALLDAGYIFLFADEYGKTKEKSVVLTFDDGYVDNYTELLPILKKYNVKATVYIIGDLVNNHHEYLTKEQIKEMADSGHVQFGCHTMSHPYLTGLNDEEIAKEYTDCKALIKEYTGQDCRSIAYPYGDYNKRVTAITKQHFDYAYNSGYYPPADDELNYYISRYYIERGITGEGLMHMIGER